MTQTKKAHREQVRYAGAEPEPPWNVVLRNDWKNSLTRVVWVLRRTIPVVTVKRATSIMWEVHTKGRAAAKRCHKELAELYEGRLRQKGLTVSIEPG